MPKDLFPPVIAGCVGFAPRCSAAAAPSGVERPSTSGPKDRGGRICDNRYLSDQHGQMSMELTEVEVRVLGALIEKDMTTPDYTALT